MAAVACRQRLPRARSAATQGAPAAPLRRAGNAVILAAVAVAGSMHLLRAGSLRREPTAPRAPCPTRPRRGRHRARLASGVAGRRDADSHSPRSRRSRPPSRMPPSSVVGDRAYAFGGLDSGGGSTTAISVVRGSSVQRPPAASPSRSTTRRRRRAGGGASSFLEAARFPSYAGIAAFDPATGGVRIVGRLPTPLSDLSVATVGRTTYAVGGFTGARGRTESSRSTAGVRGGGQASGWASLRGGGGCRQRHPDRRWPDAGGAEPRDLPIHACGRLRGEDRDAAAAADACRRRAPSAGPCTSSVGSAPPELRCRRCSPSTPAEMSIARQRFPPRSRMREWPACRDGCS